MSAMACTPAMARSAENRSSDAGAMSRAGVERQHGESHRNDQDRQQGQPREHVQTASIVGPRQASGPVIACWALHAEAHC